MIPNWLLIVVFVSIFWKIYLKYSKYGSCKSKRKLHGKTALITGGNSGIGYETALDLAYRGARVVIASETLTGCQQAAKDIIKATGNQQIIARKCDLTDLSCIRQFAEEFIKDEERLDVLINNAGCTCSTTDINKDGIPLGLQINYLGPFLLTHLLVDLLKKTKGSRIVNVASTVSQISELFNVLHTNLQDIDDLCKVPYLLSEGVIYCWSKLLVVYATWEFAARLKNHGVTVNCVHPGCVNTNILYSLKNWVSKIAFQPFIMVFYFYLKTPKEGAQTSIHCAVSEECDDITGKYFQDCQPYRPFVYKNLTNIKKAWDQSINLVKLKPEEIKI